LATEVPKVEKTGLEIMENAVCLTSYMPLTAECINKEKSEMVKCQAGCVLAIQKLDREMTHKMALLTGMKINVFTQEGLSVGDLPDYKKIEAGSVQRQKADWDQWKQEVALGEIDLKEGSYFQGVLPLYGDKGLAGMIAGFLSGQAAWNNTWQMIRLLIFVYLICIVLIIPLAMFFSHSLSTPIHKVIRSLSDAAQKVYEASFLVSSSSQQLAEKTSQQAASLEETSSSLEEMASMTRRNTDNAQQVEQLSREGSEHLKSANNSMKDLIRSMEDTSSASVNVSKIIKTIDAIAFQTNLLALNAAVEAARAGEAGAGFAVVAEEVRNLALRSAEASKNTQDRVKEITQKIEIGSALVKETDTKYRDAALKTHKVTELVGEISNASAEQNQGIDRLNRAVAEMDKVTQDNAASAEESSSAAVELKNQAEQMERILEDLIAIVGAAEAVVKGKEPRRIPGSDHPALASVEPETGVREAGADSLSKRSGMALPIQKMKETSPNQLTSCGRDGS